MIIHLQLIFQVFKVSLFLFGVEFRLLEKLIKNFIVHYFNYIIIIINNMLRKLSSKLFPQKGEKKEKKIAYNENTQLLPLCPMQAKAFGLPSKVTTNLGFDKY
jgi:hypothetical protein